MSASRARMRSSFSLKCSMSAVVLYSDGTAPLLWEPPWRCHEQGKEGKNKRMNFHLFILTHNVSYDSEQWETTRLKVVLIKVETHLHTHTRPVKSALKLWNPFRKFENQRNANSCGATTQIPCIHIKGGHSRAHSSLRWLKFRKAAQGLTCCMRRDSNSLSSLVRRRCSSCSLFSQAACSWAKACCIRSTLSTYTCFFFSYTQTHTHKSIHQLRLNQVNWWNCNSAVFGRIWIDTLFWWHLHSSLKIYILFLVFCQTSLFYFSAWFISNRCDLISH